MNPNSVLNSTLSLSFLWYHYIYNRNIFIHNVIKDMLFHKLCFISASFEFTNIVWNTKRSLNTQEKHTYDLTPDALIRWCFYMFQAPETTKGMTLKLSILIVFFVLRNWGFFYFHEYTRVQTTYIFLNSNSQQKGNRDK